jgi:hypothetical protein
MGTLVATTLQDRASGDQIAISSLDNSLELVDTATLSADSSFVLSADGVDLGGRRIITKGYVYRLEWSLWGSSNNDYMVYQLKEGGALRSAANSYTRAFYGQNAGIASIGTGTATHGYMNVSGWGTANWKPNHGYSEMFNLGSTTYPSHVLGACQGIIDTPSDTAHNFTSGPWHTSGTDMFNAVDSITVTTNAAGTMTGTLRLYKRKVS